MCKTVIREARNMGIKVGLVRPITLNPFPYEAFQKLNAEKVKRILTVEMCIPSQMIDDVRLGTQCRIPVETFGRSGGVVITPEEIFARVLALKEEVNL